MTDLIRSACLNHFAEVARSVGLDPKAMLRKAGLPLACLDHQDMRIAVNGVRRLLEVSAATSGNAEFGLRMAERSGLPNTGPVGLVVREQATVGAAIEMLSRYIHIHDEAMRVNIEYRDDVVIVSQSLRGRQPIPRQSNEWALGLVHRVMVSLSPSDWRPLEVHLVHSAPSNRAYYQHFFGCDVIFDSEMDAILCAASDMGRSIPTAHPLMARYTQSRADEIEIRSENWDDKVGEVVRSLLPGGSCTIERVAEHFACDRRTIHRHLADRNTSFSAILDAQRSDLAMRLVEDGNRPLAEMAGQLGFSSQSAMARWFRGRFGCSISQWRGRARPAQLKTESPLKNATPRAGSSPLA